MTVWDMNSQFSQIWTHKSSSRIIQLEKNWDVKKGDNKYSFNFPSFTSFYLWLPTMFFNTNAQACREDPNGTYGK